MTKAVTSWLVAVPILGAMVLAGCSEPGTDSEILDRVDSRDQTTEEPAAVSELLSAIDSRDPLAVTRAMDAGADVNARDRYDRPLLHAAIDEGNSEIVQIFVDAGADVNAREGGGGDTPLHVAIYESHPRIVRILLDAGADVNARDRNDRPLLHAAINMGDPRIVRILLDAGADVAARDREDNTPLYAAVDGGRFDIAQMLLDAGAVVDFPPNAPTAIRVVDRSDSSLTIAAALWGRGIIETHLQVRRRNTTESGEWVEADVHDTDGRLEDQGLNEDSTYHYTIRACNAVGCSGLSPETAGVTESSGHVDPPATPTGVEGLKFDVSAGTDDAGVAWTAVDRATYYEVYQGTRLDAEVSAPQTSYRDYSPNSSFGAFSTTKYQVRACNKAGCSPFSEAVTVR